MVAAPVAVAWAALQVVADAALLAVSLLSMVELCAFCVLLCFAISVLVQTLIHSSPSITGLAGAFCSQASWCTCRGGLNVDVFG